MDNYAKSNSITKIPNLKISAKTKKLFRKYRELSIITQEHLQSLSSSIFTDLGLETINISFKGQRPSRSNGKIQTLGVHRRLIFSQSIQIYKYTAVRKDLVKSKTAISTLLHEICHNIDCNIIKLIKSIHSKGFYLRLKHLAETIA